MARAQNDPIRLAQLKQEKTEAEDHLARITEELQTIAEAPRVAQQLEDWEQEWRWHTDRLHSDAYEERLHYQNAHARQGSPPPDPKEVSDMNKKWEAAYQKNDADYKQKLRDLIASGDSIRKKLLDIIPQIFHTPEDQQRELEFAHAKSDPEKLDRNNAANYLRRLAQRVPPPH